MTWIARDPRPPLCTPRLRVSSQHAHAEGWTKDRLDRAIVGRNALIAAQLRAVQRRAVRRVERLFSCARAARAARLHDGPVRDRHVVAVHMY